MQIRVMYTDDTERVYNSMKEAEADILETVLGCDFAVTVDYVEDITDRSNIKSLGCAWSVDLCEI